MLASIEIELRPKDAFDQFVLQLKESLQSCKIELNLREKGEIFEEGTSIGQVVEWRPPRRIEIDWNTAAKWDSGATSKLILDFEPLQDGERTIITIENKEWGSLVGNKGSLLSEWFADEIVANLIDSISPPRFVNWLTDRRARKPAGAIARELYRDPVYHRPNFLAVFDYLKLAKEDYLPLRAGCGGGDFLFDALKTRCRAAAIDHSQDMVKVAKELNHAAISEKRLEIFESEAESLPFSDNEFTCAVCTGVFSFFKKPIEVLAEVCRVLDEGGRLIMYIGTKELRGTPADPEPIASQVRYYEDEELVQLSRKAGFEDAKVERIGLKEYAREANIPEEARSLFSSDSKYGQILIARKI